MITEELTEFQKFCDTPYNAQIIIKTFWEISDFPSSILFDNLKEIAQTEFDDDYSEFLRGDNLLKGGLRILGLKGFSDVEKIINNSNSTLEKINEISLMFNDSRNSYLDKIKNGGNDDFPREFIKYLLSITVILLVKSKEFFREWSRVFCRIVDNHPQPDLAIYNLLSLSFRGETLIKNDYALTHRDFNKSAKLFQKIVNDSENSIDENLWFKKLQRIWDVIGEK